MEATRMLQSAGLLACLLLAGDLSAASKSRAKVSHLEGGAELLAGSAQYAKDGILGDGAPWKALAVGVDLEEGDGLRTLEGGRVELTLPDGSHLRLGEKTTITLSQNHFAKNSEREVTVKVWLGRLWARVAKTSGSKNTFKVETQNAVAGVRGTAFTVIASQDLSAVVRVYAGTVAVGKIVPGSAPGITNTRRQVPGPERIDRKQWEEIIASAMKQVKVSSLGDLSPAEDFQDSGDELKWAMWNQKRDKEAKR